MQQLTLTGEIHSIGAVQQITETFQKREIIVKTATNPQYPEYIKFEAANERMQIMDGLQVGQQILVHYNLRGRLWTNQKTGIETSFVSLNAWRIEAVGQQPQNQGQHNQGGPHSNQGGQGFSQGGQGFNQGGPQQSQGYNHNVNRGGNQGYNQGQPQQSFNQGGQNFSQGGQGFNQGEQSFNQGEQSFNQGGQGFSQGGGTPEDDLPF